MYSIVYNTRRSSVAHETGKIFKDKNEAVKAAIKLNAKSHKKFFYVTELKD